MGVLMLKHSTVNRAAIRIGTLLENCDIQHIFINIHAIILEKKRHTSVLLKCMSTKVSNICKFLTEFRMIDLKSWKAKLK